MNNETEWTLAIFAATANNLADETVWALKEIQRTRPLNPINVVARYASIARFELKNVPVPDPPSKGKKKTAVRDTNSQVEISSEWLYDFKKRAMVLNESELDGSLNLNAFKELNNGGTHVPSLEPRTSKESYLANFKDLLATATSPDNSARRYMVVLSGHGSGLLEDFLPSSTDKSKSLSISDLPKAIESLKRDDGKKKIDILGMDSCQMSMAEICYELREHVCCLIGSEGFELDTGWPYHRILSTLGEAPAGSEPTAVARDLVIKYINYYSDYIMAGVSVDQAACDLHHADNFADAVRSLVDTLLLKMPMINPTASLFESELNDLDRAIATPRISAERKLPLKARKKEINKIVSSLQAGRRARITPARSSETRFWDAIILAHWKAQSYKRGLYTDLWDFCYHLYHQLNDTDIRNACNSVMSAINGCEVEGNKVVRKHESGLVLISAHSGPEYQHSNGVSVFFPWNRSAHEADMIQYRQLSFARRTGWGEFLSQYLINTQGAIRNENNGGPAFKSGNRTTLRLVHHPFDDAGILQSDIRTNSQLGTRDNVQLGTKGESGNVITNNPPDSFYKYDEEASLKK